MSISSHNTFATPWRFLYFLYCKYSRSIRALNKSASSLLIHNKACTSAGQYRSASIYKIWIQIQACKRFLSWNPNLDLTLKSKDRSYLPLAMAGNLSWRKSNKLDPISSLRTACNTHPMIGNEHGKYYYGLLIKIQKIPKRIIAFNYICASIIQKKCLLDYYRGFSMSMPCK